MIAHWLVLPFLVASITPTLARQVGVVGLDGAVNLVYSDGDSIVIRQCANPVEFAKSAKTKDDCDNQIETVVSRPVFAQMIEVGAKKIFGLVPLTDSELKQVAQSKKLARISQANADIILKSKKIAHQILDDIDRKDFVFSNSRPTSKFNTQGLFADIVSKSLDAPRNAQYFGGFMLRSGVVGARFGDCEIVSRPENLGMMTEIHFRNVKTGAENELFFGMAGREDVICDGCGNLIGPSAPSGEYDDAQLSAQFLKICGMTNFSQLKGSFAQRPVVAQDGAKVAQANLKARDHATAQVPVSTGDQAHITK